MLAWLPEIDKQSLERVHRWGKHHETDDAKPNIGPEFCRGNPEVFEVRSRPKRDERQADRDNQNRYGAAADELGHSSALPLHRRLARPKCPLPELRRRQTQGPRRRAMAARQLPRGERMRAAA